MAFGDRLRARLQDIGAKFRDDEGLFQGGKFGRVGGRFRDWADSTRTTMGGDDTVASKTLSGLTGAAPGQDVMDSGFPFLGDPRQTTGFADARELATRFDPSNPNSVKELQLRLIDQGYLPEGADDSMFGPQTEAALRKMQGHFDLNNPNDPQNLLDYATHKWGGSADPSQAVTPDSSMAQRMSKFIGLPPGIDPEEETAIAPGIYPGPNDPYSRFMDIIPSQFQFQKSIRPSWMRDRD